MKKTMIIMLLVCILTLSSVGCTSMSSSTDEPANNEEENQTDVFGKDALEPIGNGLWYDTNTKIVYWWNGVLYTTCESCATTPSSYIAPNGLPYKYNPETKELEEIEYFNSESLK